jgi:hypothetical protein
MESKVVENKKEKKPIKIPASKNRIFIGSACIIAAVLIGFVIVPLVSSSAAGKRRSTTAVTTAAQASSSPYTLKDGQCIISITTKNFSDSLSGKLRGGDIVTAYLPSANVNNAVADTSAVNDTSNNLADNPPELQYIKVIASTTAQGVDTDDKAKNSSSANGNSQPATVTLLVNQRQAQMLAEAESRNIHFALVYRGGGKHADELLKKQNDYFTALTAQTASNSTVSNNSSSSSSTNTTSSTSAEVSK